MENLKEILQRKLDKIEAEIDDKKKNINDKEKCIWCGEDNYVCLDKHHLGWKRVGGFAKSDKKSKTIILCKNCHRKVHVATFVAIGWDIKTVDEAINSAVFYSLKGNGSKKDLLDSIDCFLDSVVIGLYKPKNDLDADLATLAFSEKR